jgi:hypothetical protein
VFLPVLYSLSEAVEIATVAVSTGSSFLPVFVEYIIPASPILRHSTEAQHPTNILNQRMRLIPLHKFLQNRRRHRKLQHFLQRLIILIYRLQQLRLVCPKSPQITYIKVHIRTLLDHTARELLHRVLRELLNNLLRDRPTDLLLVDLVGVLHDVVAERVLDDRVEVVDDEHHEDALHVLDGDGFMHEGFYLWLGVWGTTRTAVWFWLRRRKDFGWRS